ncbi:MAG: hypothetical protein JXA82_08255 [Sedimentisphaerales bacterium]|nr:hypothetical protein [Sedimentisphaerales bacterium]
MKIRDAANIGKALVIVHLALTVFLNVMYLIQYLPALRAGSTIRYLLTMPISFLASILLDVALLLVFSSLTRTMEDILRDTPEV